MSRRANAERERFWRDLLDRQHKSGLSVRRFCSVEGVSEPSFYLWRKRLQTGSCGAMPAGPAGGAPGGREPDPTLFVPLRILGGEAALEIIHPAGCRVRVIGDVNVVSLGRVLQTLDERGSR